jgi:hypothetical protein
VARRRQVVEMIGMETNSAAPGAQSPRSTHAQGDTEDADRAARRARS